MKLTKALFIVLVSLLTNSIYAQKKITFGINTGLNYSSIRESNDIIIPNENTDDSGFAFLFGLVSNYYLSGNLSLKAELNYESKRESFEIKAFQSEIDPIFIEEGNKIKTNYQFITLPILLKYEFGNSNPFFINGGPFLGYLISAKETFPNNEIIEFSERMTNFDFGLSFGVGKMISLNDKNNLIIELRNNLGLTSISKFVSAKTNSLNLIVGWNFTL